MAEIKTFFHNVPWEDGLGMSQGYSVDGRVHISGQFAHDAKGELVGVGDFDAQFSQTAANLDVVLAGFGLGRDNIAEALIYMTHSVDDFEGLTRSWRAYVGDHRPAVTMIGVAGLAFPGQRLEIRVVAYAG
ncbi:RidA family protein [Brevundimonas sp.]|uniref:RidA family protein n=1 Tax=Brevundimonas sp. TaxID=1871086 RepID=UPI003564BD57